MRKIILIAQTSLDGYVAGPKGEFDNFIDDDENLEFVCSLTDRADAALMGRISYQLIDRYWPTAALKPDATKNVIKYSDWYNRVRKIVLSKTLIAFPSKNLSVIRENIAEQINAIKQQPGKNILLFGSPASFHTLMNLKLVDELWLLIHPVIFGRGISLKAGDDVKKLMLTTTKKLASGIIAVQYRVSE